MKPVTKLPRTSRKGYALAGGAASALLLHGYTGSPYDLRPMANWLSRHDIAVHVPLLLGHGTKPRDLFHITAQDWLLQAQDVLQSLDQTKPIIVGGLSMGALLAITLAASERRIGALLLFSPALKLNLMAQLTITSAQMGLLDKQVSIKKLSGGSDIADPEAKAKTPSYLEMPIAGLLEFEKLRITALEDLSLVRCPIFLGFGTNDGAINALESHGIALERARAPIVSKFYEHSKHVITLDYDRDRLAADMTQFLSEHCGIKP